MLFDIGWPELLLIGVVALVVIGPKDLPRALRTAGYWVRKARNLSREFQGSVEQMIREAELDEMRRDLQKATEFDIEKEFNKTIDPDGSLAESIRPPDIPDHFDDGAEIGRRAAGAGSRTGAAAARPANPAPPSRQAPASRLRRPLPRRSRPSRARSVAGSPRTCAVEDRKI